MLESVYHKCLIKEFQLRGLQFESEFATEIYYKGEKIDANFRCDFLVENTIIVEIKAVTEILPIHFAQVFNYLKILKNQKHY